MPTRSALRTKALVTIRSNIRHHGFHIYTVMDRSCPSFSYTIGLTDSHGAELVLPGAVIFDTDEVCKILHAFHRKWKGTKDKARKLVVKGCGSLALRPAHPTWVRRLLLGARDHYQREIMALQIVPDAAHETIDVPDMRVAFSAKREPAWRYLRGRAHHRAHLRRLGVGLDVRPYLDAGRIPQSDVRSRIHEALARVAVDLALA